MKIQARMSLVISSVIVAVATLSFAAFGLFACVKSRVRAMVERDYGEQAVVIEFQKIELCACFAANHLVHVFFDVSVPNDGTFMNSVPRMKCIAAWLGGGGSGYCTDIFPDPWDKRVPKHELYSEKTKARVYPMTSSDSDRR
jgi:hypothetical protein